MNWIKQMKMRDKIVLGTCIGIALFFIGAIIYTIFGPGSKDDLTAYKVSATIKLLGIGLLCASMVSGGILLEKTEKDIRNLFFILGSIILIIYIAASPLLEWWVSPTYAAGASSEGAYESKPEAVGLPGFEVIYGLVVLIIMVLAKKKLRNFRR